MNSVQRAVLLAALLAALACNTDPAGPKTDYDGVRYSVVTTGRMVIVKLQNLTAAPLTRTYPSGCAVRIRLYRPLDGKLVYDEMKWPCEYDSPATILIQPQGSVQLSSGVRYGLLGDSLPAGSYIERGVLMTEGETPVEVDGGLTTVSYGAASPVLRPGTALAVSFVARHDLMERRAGLW